MFLDVLLVRHFGVRVTIRVLRSLSVGTFVRLDFRIVIVISCLGLIFGDLGERFLC